MSGEMSVLSLPGTPWVCAYRPERSVARLGEHSEVVTIARSKKAARVERASRLGRFTHGNRLPGPKRPYAMSSAMMTTKLGLPRPSEGDVVGLDAWPPHPARQARTDTAAQPGP